MMNDCRKSDIPVVHEKSSNKPDNVGAERMEERGMPKENKKQQNMLRTQRRESVHSKLQLIHQRAKAENIRISDLVSLSEGRAVCGNSARTDPCGGC